jgi:hypothetical protein
MKSRTAALNDRTAALNDRTAALNDRTATLTYLHINIVAVLQRPWVVVRTAFRLRSRDELEIPT